MYFSRFFFTVNDIDIASYAEYNTPYMIDKMILLHPLSKHPMACLIGLKTIFWKQMMTKCHLLVSTNDSVRMNVDGFKIEKSNTEKLLGLKFDKKIAFWWSYLWHL